MISFTNRDLKAATLLPPGYYQVQLNKLLEAVSKKGNSTNYVIDDAEVIADENGNAVVKGANGDDIDVAGVPIGKPWWGFNSQVLQLLIPFLEAVLKEKVTADTKINWKALEGKRIIVFIQNATVDGRMVNQVTQMYKSMP